ncbi:uncharacterized protein LOC143593332 isoform X1 [Bidens hawaiensis]|uniref:uncharacterized protein LOC143588392 isoform X1 n=1 Tax=Bidens hawaiensis TaxID=980011 RepID=UPI00404A751D
MQETKDAHDDEEQKIQESKDEKDDVDPATTNPDDPPGSDNVVEPALTNNIIETDSVDHDGSGTGSQLSEPSIKGQETETGPVNGSDHKHDITTSQESERGFSGFDLNDEFFSEEKPESSLSGTHSNSKQQSVCLDIDLNVPSGEESSVDAGAWKPTKVHLDLNMCQSMSRSSSSSSSSSSKQSSMKNFDLNNLDNVASLEDQKPVISLFGSQVEVNHMDIGPHHNGRMLGPGPSMYYYSSPYMVDPRAVPVAPQFAPPFVMNMAGGSYHGPYNGQIGSGPLQHNTGLNLGLMVNGGNSGGSSGSVVSGKRLEPDGGWEGFPVNYKHQQPPWK